MNILREHYRVLYMRRISGILTIVGRKNIKPSTETVNFKGKTFEIDFAHPYYRNKKRVLFAIDVDLGTQILDAETKDDRFSPALMDGIITDKIVEQVVSTVNREKLMTGPIIFIIMALALGICLGYIIGSYYPMGSI